EQRAIERVWRAGRLGGYPGGHRPRPARGGGLGGVLRYGPVRDPLHPPGARPYAQRRRLREGRRPRRQWRDAGGGGCRSEERNLPAARRGKLRPHPPADGPPTGRGQRQRLDAQPVQRRGWGSHRPHQPPGGGGKDECQPRSAGDPAHTPGGYRLGGVLQAAGSRPGAQGDAGRGRDVVQSLQGHRGEHPGGHPRLCALDRHRPAAADGRHLRGGRPVHARLGDEVRHRRRRAVPLHHGERREDVAAQEWVDGPAGWPPPEPQRRVRRRHRAGRRRRHRGPERRLLLHALRHGGAGLLGEPRRESGRHPHRYRRRVRAHSIRELRVREHHGGTDPHRPRQLHGHPARQHQSRHGDVGGQLRYVHDRPPHGALRRQQSEPIGPGLVPHRRRREPGGPTDQRGAQNVHRVDLSRHPLRRRGERLVEGGTFRDGVHPDLEPGSQGGDQALRRRCAGPDQPHRRGELRLSGGRGPAPARGDRGRGHRPAVQRRGAEALRPGEHAGGARARGAGDRRTAGAAGAAGKGGL
ncbi:MAG: hypothetical protein AVDCRST_MAG68-4374, partial [uncultured Gemmatimonadetes bacterium]